MLHASKTSADPEPSMQQWQEGFWEGSTLLGEDKPASAHTGDFQPPEV